MFDATPFLRLYAKHRLSRLASIDPVALQEYELRSLINKASRTKFAFHHDFSKIHDVADYQARVSLRTYEQIWNEYWKDAFPVLRDITWPGVIPYFALSSGTTSGTTKYLPLSQEMIDSNTKAGLDLLTHHVANRPKSKIFGGRSFILGSSTDLVAQTKTILSGDLSGVLIKNFPWWARARYFPPAHLTNINSWEEKMSTLAPLSCKADIRMFSGIPSWLLLFIDKLTKLHPESEGKLSYFYPNLELLVHGGINFAPYYEQFSNFLRGSHAELREVYPASEGFMAVADRGYGEGMRMNLDHGIFYEFVPVEELSSPKPTRHWIKNVELDVNYAVVLTTCAGLWSYIIGDTVRFVDRDIPRVLVTGRTSYALSAFGEHLIGEEIELAVAAAASNLHLEVTDYSVSALFPKTPSELGRHMFTIEFGSRAPSPDEASKFSSIVDEILCKRNEDYEVHRRNGFGLQPPILNVVKPGTFAAWMDSRGKLGGQNKVPRVINDQKLFANLRDFCDGHRVG